MGRALPCAEPLQSFRELFARLGTARNVVPVAEQFGPKTEMISDLRTEPTAASPVSDEVCQAVQGTGLKRKERRSPARPWSAPAGGGG